MYECKRTFSYTLCFLNEKHIPLSLLLLAMVAFYKKKQELKAGRILEKVACLGKKVKWYL